MDVSMQEVGKGTHVASSKCKKVVNPKDVETAYAFFAGGMGYVRVIRELLLKGKGLGEAGAIVKIAFRRFTKYIN